jgi:hypothetical protein
MLSDILSALINRASLLEEEILDLEDIVSQRKADLGQIMKEDIPAVLHENGLASAPLADGRTVVIDQIVNVSQKDKEALRRWLTENRYDSCIKTEFSFGKGTNTDEIEDLCRTTGIEFSKETSVHGMTLKALMKQHLADGGLPPPEEAAIVNVFEQAKVKEAKK